MKTSLKVNANFKKAEMEWLTKDFKMFAITN